ncbi:MAG: tetratricopeptide repeat protein [Candidatus Methanofastidiosia archaeon]
MIEKKYLKKVGLFLSIIVILSFFTLSKSSTQQPCEITVLGTGQYGPNGLFVTVRNNDDDQNVTLCIEWRCTCGMESCPLPSGYTCKTFFIEKGQMTSITFPIQHIPPCEEGCSGHIVTYLNVSCEKIPNEPPQAILEVQPSEGESPLQIHIKTSGEDDEKVVKYQLILKYKTKEMANIIREKPITISRVLKEAGEYKITLTVWDEEGEMDSVTETVEVRVPPEEPDETEMEAENLFNEGIHQFEAGDYEDAIETLERAKEKYGELGDNEKVTEIEEKIKVCKRYLHLSSEADGLFERAKTQYENGEYEKAKENFEKAKENYEELGDEKKAKECEKYLHLISEKEKEKEEEAGIWILSAILGAITVWLFIKRR